MSMSKRFIVAGGTMVLSLLLVITVCAASEKKAVKPADFYKGKTIELISGAAPGSAPDLLAQLIAPYLKEYTGATVIVKNMTGGGGIQGHNYVWRANPDGLTIGVHNFLIIALADIFEDPGALWKVEKFGYLFGVGSEPPVFVVRPHGPYQSVQALRAAKNLKLAGDTATGNFTLGGCTVAGLLDLDAKVVPGLKSAQNLLAIAQGQLDGAAFVVSVALTGLRQNQVKPLFVLDTKRHPALPDTPALTELVNLSGDKLKLIKPWGNTLLGSQMVFTSPGVPNDRVAFLQEAFNQMGKQSQIRQQVAELMCYSSVAYLTGVELTKMANTVTQQKTELKETLKGLLNKYCAVVK